jgi:Ca-activated chloride channel family protein
MRIPSPTMACLFLIAAVSALGAQSQEGFRFRSGVDFVNVTATVTDGSGRFVSGLKQQDFTVYEDGQVQDVSHFSSDRVPVSLGIALDSSGSMTPEKLSTARTAIERLTFDLLGDEDELFFMEFASRADITQGWTSDRQRISRAIRSVTPGGGTALYDAVATALPTVEEGRHEKKALLVISDGNDTNSLIGVGELRQRIRESEVLVYALGVDGTTREAPRVFPPQFPPSIGFPIPGGRRRLPPGAGGGSGTWPGNQGDRVNAGALRQITDDTGGRTEIVRGFEGLDDATARIADELSRQYFLGYTSSASKDGRWHSIRVAVRDRSLTVRARRGYVAS